jgi:polyisoprenoid-binding protein YceI
MNFLGSICVITSNNKYHKRKDTKMTTWKIDPAHSEINFKVKHLVVSTVRGNFDTFNAKIETSKEDFSDAKISFDADINSINTNNEQRDNHLKSADFFDAENHPKMSFESTSVKKVSDNDMEVNGHLTIRGVKKEITLKVIFNGVVTGFGNVEVAGFEITSKLNRFDYGLKWNTLTEAGGVVVGEEVKIEIHAEFNKVNEAVKAA